MNNNKTTIAKKITELFAITKELEELYPGRKFTIDGHLVGSIGEVLVADKFNLTLLPNSTKTHDAVDNEGKYYQIKATQTDRIALSSEPDFLIVVKLHSDGTWDVVYNGPGKIIWDNSGKMQKNGQRPISLSKIKKLMG
jgi:hypothetical protein